MSTDNKTAEILSLSQRPKSLSAMFGMDAAISVIRKQMTTRPARTILITGDPGVGKTTLARIIALSVQCEHSKLWGDPCEVCRKQVKSWDPFLTEFAIHEINASEHSGVEELEVICKLSYNRPMTGRRRVIILDEVHELSAKAWSTTLKPMESPPEHVVWILCTSNPKKVPAANQRRAVKYAMKTLGISDVEAFLTKYAKHAGVTQSLTPLFEVCHTMQVGSPGVLLQALEKYAAGASAKDAVTGSDGSGVDSFRICKAVTNGDWKTVAGFIKDMTPEDTRWIQMSLAGWLKGCMVRAQGVDAERAALSLIELSTPPWDETMRATWLAGILFKATKRYTR